MLEAKRPRPDRLWPIAITVGLLIMMAVNFCFMYIALSGADEIVPSYFSEER
jgi:hypothetical protein